MTIGFTQIPAEELVPYYVRRDHKGGIIDLERLEPSSIQVQSERYVQIVDGRPWVWFHNDEIVWMREPK